MLSCRGSSPMATDQTGVRRTTTLRITTSITDGQQAPPHACVRYSSRIVPSSPKTPGTHAASILAALAFGQDGSVSLQRGKLGRHQAWPLEGSAGPVGLAR
jgi:hypothetical protein